MLGEDRGAEFTLDKIGDRVIDHEAAMARRLAFREQVRAEREAKRAPPATQVIAMPRVQRKPRGRPVLVAVASKGSGLINEHFGYAREFLVYEAGEAGVRLVGHRKTGKYCSGAEHCGGEDAADERRIDRLIGVLDGCAAVLCARIGIEPWNRLEAAGIRPNTAHAMENIEEAVAALWRELLEAGELGNETADGAAERQRA